MRHVETPPNKLLILSSSTVNYREAGESLLSMVEARLRFLQPAEWQCAGEVLYVSETMAERALRLVERHRPSHILLRPTGLAFMHDDVVNVIRDRWPRLYRPAVRLSDLFRYLGGGVRRGARGPRGWLFRNPRAVAARIIGEAPRLRVEVATDYVLRTIDELVRLEDVDLMCRLSVGNDRTLKDEAEHQRRLTHFVRGVREGCERRLVPFADNADLYREAGLDYQYVADQWHKTPAMILAEAAAIARDVAARARAAPSPA